MKKTNSRPSDFSFNSRVGVTWASSIVFSSCTRTSVFLPAAPAGIVVRTITFLRSSFAPVTVTVKSSAANAGTAATNSITHPKSALILFLHFDEFVFGGPGEWAAGFRPPQHRVLDLPGQCEVLVGDPACRVRLEFHPDLGPGHRQVRMVVGGLGQKANRLDENQGRTPAVE